jgi:hypothetical protein
MDWNMIKWFLLNNWRTTLAPRHFGMLEDCRKMTDYFRKVRFS